MEELGTTIPDTTNGTAIFADQLGWFWGVNVGIYGIHGVSGYIFVGEATCRVDTVECSAQILPTIVQVQYFVHLNQLGDSVAPPLEEMWLTATTTTATPMQDGSIPISPVNPRLPGPPLIS